MNAPAVSAGDGLGNALLPVITLNDSTGNCDKLLNGLLTETY